MKELLNLRLLTISILLFSVCPEHSSSQNNIDPEIQARIDAFVNEVFLPQSQTNGLGLAIVQNNGAILYTAGYGFQDLVKQTPMTSKSQFVTGSISKSITAAMAAKILHENFPHLGEGVMDTPVVQLVPQANFTLSDRFRTEYVTFRDLLSHQVCIHGNDMQAFAGALKTQDEAIYRARYNSEVCRLRTYAAYINQMIEAAGYLSAMIVNKTYEEALRDFFDELGMFNSTVVLDSDDPEELPNRSMPYYLQNGELLPFNYGLTKRLAFAQASGGVVVTPEDMVRYMRYHINRGELDGVQIVNPAVIDWIHRPSVIWPGYSYKGSDTDMVMSMFGYGLGMWVGSFDGWHFIQHAGNAPPYTNIMAMGPAFGLGVYTAMNMGPSHADQWALQVFILEVLRGTAGPDAEERAIKLMHKLIEEEKLKKEKEQKEHERVWKSKVEEVRTAQSCAKADILGEYGTGSFGELEISEKFNSERNQTEYFIDYGRWYRGWLIPGDDPNVYGIEWVTDVYQDNYVLGVPLNSALAVGEDRVVLTATANLVAEFRRGVNLDVLPRIPWAPESCGP